MECWPEKDRRLILSVKTGITDYATFYYRDDQTFLARVEDPEKAYLEVVMPHKLRLYRRYLEDRNLWFDLRLLAATEGDRGLMTEGLGFTSVGSGNASLLSNL